MHYIGFLVWTFVGMTLLNRILDGFFIAGSEIETLNSMSITHSTQIGWATIPVINWDFFFVGLPRLVKWDYSFFGGNAALFQFFLYSLTFALSFMLFTLIVGLFFQYFTRR